MALVRRKKLAVTVGSSDDFHNSGQIIAPAHHLTPKRLPISGESPKISGKSRLVKSYFIWPENWD